MNATTQRAGKESVPTQSFLFSDTPIRPRILQPFMTPPWIASGPPVGMYYPDTDPDLRCIPVISAIYSQLCPRDSLVAVPVDLISEKSAIPVETH